MADCQKKQQNNNKQTTTTTTKKNKKQNKTKQKTNKQTKQIVCIAPCILTVKFGWNWMKTVRAAAFYNS